MMTEVGVRDARNNWSRLLRDVRAGRSYRITDRGLPVADLVPCVAARAGGTAAAIARFQAFLRASPVKVSRRLDFKAFVREGRL